MSRPNLLVLENAQSGGECAWPLRQVHSGVVDPCSIDIGSWLIRALGKAVLITPGGARWTGLTRIYADPPNCAVARQNRKAGRHDDVCRPHLGRPATANVSAAVAVRRGRGPGVLSPGRVHLFYRCASATLTPLGGRLRSCILDLRRMKVSFGRRRRTALVPGNTTRTSYLV